MILGKVDHGLLTVEYFYHQVNENTSPDFILAQRETIYVGDHKVITPEYGGRLDEL